MYIYTNILTSIMMKSVDESVDNIIKKYRGNPPNSNDDVMLVSVKYKYGISNWTFIILIIMILFVLLILSNLIIPIDILFI